MSVSCAYVSPYNTLLHLGVQGWDAVLGLLPAPQLRKRVHLTVGPSDNTHSSVLPPSSQHADTKEARN